MEKRTIFIFAGIFILIALTPILIYVFHFWNNDISSNPADWTNFANYFSGLTVPVLTFFNLVILVWITIVVEKLDSDRKEKELDFQKQLVEVSNNLQKEIAFEANNTQKKAIKSQLQFEQYCKLSDKLDLIGVKLFEEKEPSMTVVFVNEFLKEFSLAMEELLPVLKDTSDMSEINELLDAIKQNFLYFNINPIKKIDVQKINVQKINKQLVEFQYKKLIFLRKLQKNILDGLK